METQKIKLTPWHGGECPVTKKYGLVQKRDGEVGYGYLSNYRWCHANYDNGLDSDYDIIAYAVIQCEIIEPPHSTIVPQAVWDVLPDYINAAVTLRCGRTSAICSNKAYHGSRDWDGISGCVDITDFKGVIPAKCDWKDSLVYRPK